MKFLRLTLLIALVGGFVFMSSCGKGTDPKPALEKVNLGLLSKTWVITSAELGSADMTDVYANMELTISGTYNKDINTLYNYSLTGRPNGVGEKSPWPASGTWKFKDGQSGEFVVRTEDNLVMGYTVTETQLQITFNYQGAGYAGRTSAVTGDWIFNFEPK